MPELRDKHQLQSEVALAAILPKVVTVPANVEWILQSVVVTLVTTAEVGNRQLRLQLRDASNVVIATLEAGVVQAASLTRHYVFGDGLPKETAFVIDTVFHPMPQILLPATWDMSITDSAAIDLPLDQARVITTILQEQV